MAPDRPDAAPLTVRLTGEPGSTDDGRVGARALRRRRVVAALRPGAGRRIAAADLPRDRGAAPTRSPRSNAGEHVDRVAARRSAARRRGDPPAVRRAAPTRGAFGSTIARRHGRHATARRHRGRPTAGSSSTTARSPPLVGAALRLPVNRGPAAARNCRPFTRRHADSSRSSTPTSTCPSGWLEPLLPHFDDPRVGLVAPRVTGERGSPLDLGVTPARIRAGTRVSYVPGAAIVMRVDRVRRDRRVRRADALRRGRRPRLAARRGGMAVPVRAGLDRLAPTAATVSPGGCASTPGTARRPHRSRCAIRGALAPLRSNGWTASAWALVALGHPVGRRARWPSDRPARSSASSRTSRPRPRSGWRCAAISARRSSSASAVRREWWPVVAVGALGVEAGALDRRRRACSPTLRAAPTDAAYGWGVWTGMIRHRTIAPIVPRLAAWPNGRRTARTRQYRRDA